MIRKIAALGLIVLACGLSGCGVTSTLTQTPIGTVAFVEANGWSGSREITCLGNMKGRNFVYKAKNCQTSVRHSVGHSVATAVAGSIIPSAIHGGVALRAAKIASRNSGPSVYVEGSRAIAVSGSTSISGASATVFEGH